MQSFYTVVRYLAYLIEILVFFIIEQSPTFPLKTNGLFPTLLVPAAVVIALFEGEKVGTIFGLIIGVILDIGYSGTLGVCSVLMACMGFFVGTLSRKVIRCNFFTSMITLCISTLIFYLVHFAFYYLLQGYSDILYTLTTHYLPRFFYTILVSPIIYFFNRSFAINIKGKEA